MKKNKYLTLLNNLIITELKLRYKSSILGFLWALIEPLSIALILLLVFTQLFTSNLANFPGYLLTGFIVWFFLSDGTNRLEILVSKKEIIQKIKFPNLIIILSQTITVFIESLASFIILIFILVFILKINLTINIIALPLLLILQFVFVLGLSIILSSLYVFIRDLSKIWSIFMQVWFFLTPIVYPQALLTKKNYILLTLNPMLYFINAYRNILVYGKSLTFNSLLILCFISSTTLIIGYKIFKKIESRISEEL